MSTLTGENGHENSTIVRSNDDEVPGYPSELIRPIALRDGARLRLRPIRPDDEPRLVEFFHRLSPRTVYQRFLAPFHRLPAAWYHYFANVDYRKRLALVVEEPGAQPVLRAVARYEPGDAREVAELAIVVEDAWQDRGLGTILLDAVLDAAEARGIRRFTADLLAENQRILHVLWRLGEIRHPQLERGVLTIEFERRRALARLPA